MVPRLKTTNGHCSCAVSTCSSHGHKISGLIYHRFPKEKAIQLQWIARCKRPNHINVNCAKICSLHFPPEDYKRDLQNELLGLPIKKRLLPTAVPSQHLPLNWQDSDNKVVGEHDERSRLKSKRKRPVTSLPNVSPVKKIPGRSTNASLVCQLPEFIAKNEEIKLLQEEIKRLRNKNVVYEVALRKCLGELKQAKASKRVVITQPKKNISLTPRELRLKVKEEVQKTLAVCFTPGQIHCLLNGNERGKWNSDDIERALTLRGLSSKSYDFLRKCNIPLPSHTTLQKWSKIFKSRPGVSETSKI